MYTATFPGSYSSLEKIAALTARIAEEAGFDENGIYQIQLAVDEAATNIIEHAYKGNSNGLIELSFEITASDLIIRLRDFGKAFDPGAVPEPQLNLDLEEISTRGLGVYWMRKLMNEVRYEFDQEQGNLLTMVKKRRV